MSLDASEKVFSCQELHRYNDEFGYYRYIAYQGVVYDVSDCPKWQHGMHETQHWPGQELTNR